MLWIVTCVSSIDPERAGLPDWIRTSGLRIRNPAFYPAELRGVFVIPMPIIAPKIEFSKEMSNSERVSIIVANYGAGK